MEMGVGLCRSEAKEDGFGVKAIAGGWGGRS